PSTTTGEVFHRKNIYWWLQKIRRSKLRSWLRGGKSLISVTMLRSVWTISGLPPPGQILRANSRRSVLPPCVPPVCLASSNPLNSEFCRGERSRNAGLTLQEPCGDSRPQTFFLRGSAPPARGEGR